MRPPLTGKRDAARRLVDGLRRSVADVIAPGEPAPEVSSAPQVARGDDDADAGIDAGARIDAARERLRSAVPPREDDEARQ